MRKIFEQQFVLNFIIALAQAIVFVVFVLFVCSIVNLVARLYHKIVND